MTANPPRRICGAKTRSGKPCQSSPVRGRDRCRMHGGTQKRGISSHSFKHGRYSQHLPDRMKEHFEAALNDPDLLALNAEIALIEARMSDLLTRVDTGENGTIWARLQEAMREYRKADSKGDSREVQYQLGIAEGLILDGQRDMEAWVEIQMLIEQRRKVTESEQKRRTAMSNMITAEQAMLLLAAIEDTLRKHITDPTTLDAIGRELERLSDAPGGKRNAWE